MFTTSRKITSDTNNPLPAWRGRQRRGAAKHRLADRSQLRREKPSGDRTTVETITSVTAASRPPSTTSITRFSVFFLLITLGTFSMKAQVASFLVGRREKLSILLHCKLLLTTKQRGQQDPLYGFCILQCLTPANDRASCTSHVIRRHDLTALLCQTNYGFIVLHVPGPFGTRCHYHKQGTHSLWRSKGRVIVMTII